jgi:hypothetical protein
MCVLLKNKVLMTKTPKNKPNFTLFSICVEKNRIFLTTTEYFFKRIRNVFPSYVTSETKKKYWINIYGMPRKAETKVMENYKNNEIIYQVTNMMNSSKLQASHGCHRQNLSLAAALHKIGSYTGTKTKWNCKQTILFHHKNSENRAKKW